MNGLPPDTYRSWQPWVKIEPMGGPGSASRSIATLTANGAKARFGVAYLRAVCSHAGVGFQEVSVDEDVLAIDGMINFDLAEVRVQVKCTGGFRINGGKTAT